MGEYTLFLLAAPIALLIGYNIYAVRKHAASERKEQLRESRTHRRHGSSPHR